LRELDLLQVDSGWYTDERYHPNFANLASASPAGVVNQRAQWSLLQRNQPLVF